MQDRDGGVAFPQYEASRSTSTFGRSVLGAALSATDPVGQRSVEAEANWRSGYLAHFRRLVEAGLSSPGAAFAIAQSGMDAVASGMRWIDPATGRERSLAGLEPAVAGEAHSGERAVQEVRGGGEPAPFALPYRGRLLTGARLEEQLDGWVGRGVMEPGAADAVREVAAHPRWLALPGCTVVALGAGAEIGPTPTLLRWGARVAGVDLARPDIWRRVIEQAEHGAGTLLVPVRTGSDPVAERAGLDLLTELPALASWVNGLADPDGPEGPDPRRGGSRLVLGNYLYADGASNLRVSAAGDALATMLRRFRPDLVQAYLATPTDVFAVPGADVVRSVAGYESAATGWAARGLRMLSAGRLLRRAYLPGADPGICDSLVAQQGPNYALAKRMQRWRATTERAAGRRVSMNVAPPTRTRSVLKNRALAAAYAGAHRFGVEVFEPSTTRVLMAALLVHDLCTDPPSFAHPWQAEAHRAVHGGLWTGPFEPRSALGLAAVLGFGASRT